MAVDLNQSLNRWQQALKTTVCYQWLITGEEEKFWERFAEDYYRNRTSGPHFRDVVKRMLKAVPNGCELLEIGPGPGVFTLPLAEHVKSITAIEPSPAVVKILKEKIAHLDNIRIINDSWENVSVEPHDVVLAAGVLYAFYDLESAIKKMIQHALQKVIVVTLKDEQPLLEEMAEAFHLPPPKPASPPFELILDVLKDVTTSFRCEKITGKQIYHYRSLSFLLESWKHRLELTPEALLQIKSFLERKGSPCQGKDEISIPRVFSSYMIEIYG